MAESLKSRTGHKAATLADVGREAGVSAMAASAVLNGARTTARISDETRSRVLEAAERLRYRPDEAARALTHRRMNTIGVVATLLGSEPNLYFLEIFNGVLRGAAAAGQNTTVFTLDGWDDAAQRIARFCDGRIDGLILVAPMLEDDPSTWLPPHTPVVSIHANREIAGVANLESDEEAGAFQAVSRLLELGHRRILHVGGPMGSTGADRRIDGYMRAHEAAGVPLLHDPVVRDAYTFEAGRGAMESWLQRHRGEELPQAVFAGSDAIALGCIDALAARGLRVPADVSVVGFDDTLLARTSRLATVRQPLQQMGRQAAEVLLSRIETRHENPLQRAPRNVVLPTELVAGATLAAPRTAPLAIG
ncbi:LacI family DNA-binding transcriptional regulator [Ideonella sp.]|uniref:LacI family DNA-binding transcriptional regulator n=1 Tax=Ideonella sp. TaxID=1929293 RepID=UPI002B496CF7|nr:LacI family DNA-binding transcriptional regulator [Ideonella sp.]HJV69235.1 LacI family DNA-binding transcriptional regulator [Ideonella sp.]